MLIACLDLEGVLFPEVWINVAKKTGIDELKLTTRDISDYDELMGIRLKIIAEKGLTLKDIQDTIDTMDPLPGAVEFLDWLRETCQVIILSDTFEAFARPIMRKLKMPAIFCHEIGVDENNVVNSYKLRIPDAKTKAIDAFRGLNFRTLAVGDSFNDLGMLQRADHGIFFKPPAEIAAQYSEIPVAQDYEALKVLITNLL
jgi:phosphoserine/homoserine phosphotransferase